jgi:DNA ligase (NAD+)
VAHKNDDHSTVSELVQKILMHKRQYYAGHPTISDQEYDLLEEKLRELAPDHPALSMVGAPGTGAGNGNKVTHEIPMLSLQKSYDFKDLIAWANQKSVVGSLKLDGNSLALVYRQGKFALAKTRGNGRVGEDATEKARWVTEIPQQVAVEAAVEIRGELYCSLTRFAELSDEMEQLGLERPSNPRNIVAGILGRKGFHEFARFFSFCAFDVICSDNSLAFSTEWEKLEWLKKQGFRLADPKLLTSAEEISDYLEEVKEIMESSDIGLDGAVFTYNKLALHEEYGNTSHHPRYRMSFKWQGTTAIVKIKKIIWATSRYGVVTPVAVIDPVSLSGALITNITLHNALNVINNNLKAGDEIEIVRSGEVIPKFLRVVNSAAGHYDKPDHCPSCNSELIFDKVRFKCPNSKDCPAQNLRSILNWIRCLEIDDLSEKRLEKMIELGLVKTIPDLYRLSLQDLLTLPATKQKMAQKLLSNINASRSRPLAQFLNGLSIEGAGLTTWEKLLERFHTLENLQQALVSDIQQISGFAEKTANQIVDGLRQRRLLIEELLNAGVAPVASELTGRLVKDSPIAGKQIVLTGKFSTLRNDLEKLIKQYGGHPSSSVSKNTFAVVSGDNDKTSTKLKKALELKVPIWSEQQLLDSLNSDKGME